MHDFVRGTVQYSWRPFKTAGFTYVGLLIMIAVIGMVAAATLQLGAVLQRRAAEEELLAIGIEFRLALLSFAAATPPGQQIAPQALQDLLKDPRYPNVRRHLRKLHNDPITGYSEWGIAKTIDGKGILGIYSLSTSNPIKIGNFPAELRNFEGKTSYSDWVFAAVPPNFGR